MSIPLDDEKIALFQKVGLIPGAKKMPKKKAVEKKEVDLMDMFQEGTTEAKEPDEDMSEESFKEIINRLDIISSRLAAVEAKMDQAQSYSSGGGGGFKKKKTLSEVKKVNATIEKVYSGTTKNGGFKKWDILYNGTKVSTLDKSLGEKAEGLEGMAVILTVGKNAKGYDDLADVEAAF